MPRCTVEQLKLGPAVVNMTGARAPVRQCVKIDLRILGELLRDQGQNSFLLPGCNSQRFFEHHPVAGHLGVAVYGPIVAVDAAYQGNYLR